MQRKERKQKGLTHTRQPNQDTTSMNELTSWTKSCFGVSWLRVTKSHQCGVAKKKAELGFLCITPRKKKKESKEEEIKDCGGTLLFILYRKLHLINLLFFIKE